MNSMFQECNNLINLDLNFDTSHVIDIRNIFNKCNKLKDIKEIKGIKGLNNFNANKAIV